MICSNECTVRTLTWRVCQGSLILGLSFIHSSGDPCFLTDLQRTDYLKVVRALRLTPNFQGVATSQYRYSTELKVVAVRRCSRVPRFEEQWSLMGVAVLVDFEQLVKNHCLSLCYSEAVQCSTCSAAESATVPGSHHFALKEMRVPIPKHSRRNLRLRKKSPHFQAADLDLQSVYEESEQAR